MEPAAPNVPENQLYPLEVCNCPPNFVGRFCEDCAPGYYRSSGLLNDSCISCICNNLTDICNDMDGVCINCTGFSYGDHCEVCLPGYYGDPTRGIPCQPCSCPSATVSRSPTCILDTDGMETCNACEEGYTGRNCEQCENGFFGNAVVSQLAQ